MDGWIDGQNLKIERTQKAWSENGRPTRRQTTTTDGEGASPVSLVSVLKTDTARGDKTAQQYLDTRKTTAHLFQAELLVALPPLRGKRSFTPLSLERLCLLYLLLVRVSPALEGVGWHQEGKQRSRAQGGSQREGTVGQARLAQKKRKSQVKSESSLLQSGIHRGPVPLFGASTLCAMTQANAVNKSQTGKHSNTPVV